MRVLFIIAISLNSIGMYGQKTQLGVEYGRAYFFYDYKDDGNGFINEKKANYHFITGLILLRQIRNNLYLESGFKFSLYEQYFSTKKYWGAHESAYPVIMIPINIRYETSGRVAAIFSGGAIIGFCS